MRQRIVLLAVSLTALLGASGCVSVPASPEVRPAAPGPVPAGDRDRSPLSPEPQRPARPPAPAKSASAAPGDSRGQSPGVRPPQRVDPGRTAVPDAPRAVLDPPGRAASDETAQRPRIRPYVRPVQPPSREMRSLCEASSGIADPAITRACRDAYR
ncbi:hypothetical protein ABT391_27285 [Streptomyces jumonjinensis]|uniref:hypothetical protein n=1 Tax=Streptomyces jumonjinensis TaxID=1945 RepID=UPI00332A5FD7